MSAVTDSLGPVASENAVSLNQLPLSVLTISLPPLLCRSLNFDGTEDFTVSHLLHTVQLWSSVLIAIYNKKTLLR